MSVVARSAERSALRASTYDKHNLCKSLSEEDKQNSLAQSDPFLFVAKESRFSAQHNPNLNLKDSTSRFRDFSDLHLNTLNQLS